MRTEVSHPSQLKRRHVISYKEMLENKGLAPKTVLKKLSAVSSFCRFLAEEVLTDRDLTYGISRPDDENQTETSDLKDSDVQRLFASLNPGRKNFHSYRAILAVGFYAGFRVSEIVVLRIKNIGTVEGIKIFRTRLKNDTLHEVVIHPFVLKALDSHLTRLREHGFDTHDPEQVLFPSLKTMANRPMTKEGIAYIFKTCLEKAGISQDDFRRYSTHTMRTTFASHLLDSQEIPLQKVQRLMGHKNPSTTQKYNKRLDDHAKSPVFKISY